MDALYRYTQIYTVYIDNLDIIYILSGLCYLFFLPTYIVDKDNYNYNI